MPAGIRSATKPTTLKTRLRRPRTHGLGPQGTPVEWAEEESYFFRLSAYQDKLLALYEATPTSSGRKTAPTRSMSFVKGRTAGPFDSRTTFTGASRCRATRGTSSTCGSTRSRTTITGVGFPDVRGPMFGRYWPADVHVIGKDIVRFHAVYWPAFLMSAGLPLPKRVFAHGSCTAEGRRCRSRGQRRRSRRSSATTASTRCAISSCGSAVRPGRRLQPRRHRSASTPTSPTTSVTSPSARFP